MQYGAWTYNVFAMTTLGYVAQLEAPPKWLLTREKEMLQRAATGPRHWATAEDMWHLKDGYAFARSFTCLTWLAKACQLRAYVLDPSLADKGHIACMVAQTRKLFDQPVMKDTRHAWADWFERSFLMRLEDNLLEFTAHHGPVPDTQGTGINNNLQGLVYEKWSHHDRYSPEERIRSKQRRWQLTSSRTLAGITPSARQ